MSWRNAFNSALSIGLPVAGGVLGTVFGGPVGGLAGAAIGQGAYSAYSNYLNYESQEEQYEYQKALQKQQWAREDDAVRRRTNDLLAAGLSPTLAAGSAADAGQFISTKAPQYGDIKNDPMAVLSMLRMASDIETTKVQRDLIKANIQNSLANAAIRWHDFKIFEETNTPSNAGGLVNNLRSVLTGGNFKDIPTDILNLKDQINDKIHNGNIFNMPNLQFSPQQIEDLKSNMPSWYKNYLKNK